MRLSNWSLLCGGVISMLLIAPIPQARSAPLFDSITITLEATFTMPPCEINVPPVVHLGSISYGEKRYRPVTLTVNCTSAARSEIYAQTAGLLVSGTTDTTAMTGADALTHFWLEENGKKIKLNGETNTTDSGFCAGTDSRTCTLTPATQVGVAAQEGERSAVIKFNVRYKA